MSAPVIASSVSSMPSNAADWSAANAVSPVTTASAGTIARIAATSDSTTCVRVVAGLDGHQRDVALGRDRADGGARRRDAVLQRAAGRARTA